MRFLSCYYSSHDKDHVLAFADDLKLPNTHLKPTTKSRRVDDLPAFSNLNLISSGVKSVPDGLRTYKTFNKLYILLVTLAVHIVHDNDSTRQA